MSVLEITAEQYHADDTGSNVPTLSSSIAKIICTRSAAHARAAHPLLNPEFQRKESDAFDLGKAAHSLLLEGDDLIVEVDAEAWTTKAAKEARAEARAAGMVPMLVSQARRTRAMVAAIRAQLDEYDLDPPPFAGTGQPERSIVWEEQGVTCRARLDWLHTDPATIDDLKSTSESAELGSWNGTMINRGFDIQAAMYLRGLRALGARRPRFRFVVVEVDPPYALQVFDVGADVLAVADAKVDYAILTWRQCLETGEWPAYPRRVQTLELRPWDEARWMERQARAAA